MLRNWWHVNLRGGPKSWDRFYDSFVGPGYAQASKEGEIASKVFANLEGIFLDPAYTGKAAAALLDYSENTRFGGGPVLFIHTGGNAGLYY